MIDGKIGEVIPAPKIDGTQITIQNLFYNTPARRKFLKTPRTEGRKILETVKNFGLSCPQVGFSLIIDVKKVAILSTGTIISECIEAIKILNKKNIKPSLYNFHTVKPLDKEQVYKISKNYKFLFTVEEHNVIGGLGSAVSETIKSISQDKKNNLKSQNDN